MVLFYCIIILSFVATGITLDYLYNHSPEYLAKTNAIDKLDDTSAYYLRLVERENKGENVVKEKDSTWTYITGLVRKDAKGRRAVFDIGILTDEYHWQFGSTEINHRNKNNTSFNDFIASSNFLSRIRKSKGVICVGNSSFEKEIPLVQQSNFIHSDITSGARCAIMTETINPLVDTSIGIYMLDIGQSILQKKAESDNQRSVVIILIQKYDADVDFNEATYRAMLGLQGMPFRLLEFSLGNRKDFSVEKRFN